MEQEKGTDSAPLNHNHVQQLLDDFFLRASSREKEFHIASETAPCKQTFSIFDLDDNALAQSLMKEFWDADAAFREQGFKGDDLCRKMIALGEELKEKHNSLVVKYAWTVYVNHSSDDVKSLKPLMKPVKRHAWMNIHPLVPEPSPEPTDPYLELHSNVDAERLLSYWREDEDLNSHHWNWHTVFPADGVPSKGDTSQRHRKPKQGELFMYMHRQLIARYDAERLGVNLRPVHSFGGGSYREVIQQGYDSHLVMFCSRPAGLRLGDLNSRSEDPTAIRNISHMEMWRDRLWDAVDSGKFRLRSNSGQPDQPMTMDNLGEVIETSVTSQIDTGSHGYYGNLHNTGHNMIALCHDPDRENDSMIQPMGDVIASIRDPVFWEWHKHIDDFGFRYEQRHAQDLQSYIQPYKPKNLEIAAVELYKFAKKSDNGTVEWSPTATTRLDTFMERKTIKLTLDSALIGFTTNDANNGRGMLTSTRDIHRLNYDAFQYRIAVKNRNPLPSENTETQWLTVRIFLAPTKFMNDRRKWIEMDKFRYEAPMNAPHFEIKRSSFKSSILQHKQNEPWKYGEDDGTHSDDPDPRCRCGLPPNLLLPRGTKEQDGSNQASGLPARLFVMLTVNDWNDKCACANASSYCGSNDTEAGYPDNLPLGYPFTNPFTNPFTDVLTHPDEKFPEKWLNHDEDHIRVVPISIYWGADRVKRHTKQPEMAGVLTGNWIYRSYRNLPEVQNPADAAAKAKAWDKVVFGEGRLLLKHDAKRNSLSGSFDFGEGFACNVTGSFDPNIATLRMEAVGIAGTPTKDWQYVYEGYIAPHFQNGLPETQPCTCLGTVMRAKQHDTAPAFYCASFQMIQDKK